MGIASLILGILSMGMLALIIIVRINLDAIPTILAMIGLILGIKGRKQEKSRQATIGIVLCSTYLGIFLITIIRSILIIKNALP